VVRSNGEDGVLARAVNLLIARHAYRERSMLQREQLQEQENGISTAI
jgi:hypothetical protein